MIYPCLVLSCADEFHKDRTLQNLIRPSCGVEEWITEGWDLLDGQEKTEVEARIASVFKDGFPVKLEHDRVIYLYIFTLLSQLEIVALQLPLRAYPQLKDDTLKSLMRQQLVDEVFHAMLFSKIANELASPYAYPPQHNQCIENICDFIRQEQDVTTAIVLLNLVAESWFEEFLNLLSEKNVAPKIFDVILEDERRHVKEAELYSDLGMPSKQYLSERINQLETDLMGDLFLQQKYSMAMVHAIGKSGCLELISRIYFKHNEQLAKIDITPNEKWSRFMGAYIAYLDEIEESEIDHTQVDLTPTRRVVLGAWRTPVDPTMFSVLSLNVTRLETFENKYPPQTLTGLMLQAMSKLSKDNPSLRNYVSHNKIYNMSDNYIHLVINLPGSTNHLAMIKFKDVHEISLQVLSERVQNYVEIMSYARYKSQELAKENPQLLDDFYSATIPDPNDIFKEILFPHAIFTLTNVGPWGGEINLSPLLPFEVLKLTMSQVERKQVWNNKLKEFEIQDRLPIGLSADHRVFDANMGTPKMLQIALDEMIDKLEQNSNNTQSDSVKPVDIEQFIELSEIIMNANSELGFYFLTASSHCWSSDTDVNTLKEKLSKVMM